MKRSHRTLARTLLPLLGILSLVACGADTGSDVVADPSAEGAEALSDGPPGAPRGGPEGRHGRPGPELLFVTALDTLDLTAAQRGTIEKSLTGLRPEAADDKGPPERALFTALAAEVRAGRVDAEAFLAKADAEMKRPERIAKLEAAMTTLHDTLSPAQRRELVDTMLDGLDKKHGPDGAPGREFGPGPGGAPPPGRGGERGPFGHLFADLGLTDGQSQSIQAILDSDRPTPPDEATMKAHFEAHRAELRTRLEAFVADAFDAHALATPPAPKDGMDPRKHMEGFVRVLARVVPVLDPAQRETVAARLLEGPPRGPGAHRGGPGGRGAPPGGPGKPPPAGQPVF